MKMQSQWAASWLTLRFSPEAGDPLTKGKAVRLEHSTDSGNGLQVSACAGRRPSSDPTA